MAGKERGESVHRAMFKCYKSLLETIARLSKQKRVCGTTFADYDQYHIECLDKPHPMTVEERQKVEEKKKLSNEALMAVKKTEIELRDIAREGLEVTIDLMDLDDRSCDTLMTYQKIFIKYLNI